MVRDAYVGIADPTRREILNLLRERDTVAAGEIAARIGRISRPAVSRHLRILRECGLVSCEKEGKTQSYSLNPQPIKEIEGWLEGFSKRQVKSLDTLRDIAESDR